MTQEKHEGPLAVFKHENGVRLLTPSGGEIILEEPEARELAEMILYKISPFTDQGIDGENEP